MRVEEAKGDYKDRVVSSFGSDFWFRPPIVRQLVSLSHTESSPVIVHMITIALLNDSKVEKAESERRLSFSHQTFIYSSNFQLHPYLQHPT